MTDSTHPSGDCNPQVASLDAIRLFPWHHRRIIGALIALGPEASPAELGEWIGVRSISYVHELISAAASEGYIDVTRRPGRRSLRYTRAPEVSGIPESAPPESAPVTKKEVDLMEAASSNGNPPGRARAREATPDPKPVDLRRHSVGRFVTARRDAGGRPISEQDKRKVGSIVKAMQADGSGTDDEIIEAVERTAADPSKGPGWIRTELQRLQEGQPPCADRTAQSADRTAKADRVHEIMKHLEL